MYQVFALLTDFGLQDPYVGQMKAKLISRAASCTILDISHDIRPILQAGFFLSASWPYLPPGTVCLAVVDPEVGTSRRILVLAKENKLVLAPDNGILSQLLQMPGANNCYLPWNIFQAEKVSPTFHGRDIFAPLAADLAQSSNLQELLQPVSVEDIHFLSAAKPQLQQNILACGVQHVDRFGNCILNLRIQDWSKMLLEREHLFLRQPGQTRVYPAHSYALIPKGQIGLLPGSQDFLELALEQQSCADALGLLPGSRVDFDL